jgi:glycosyl transferase family 25
MLRNPARTINSWFPHKICINLDRRSDRWEQMQVKFAQHEILAVKRLSAIDGKALVLPPNWSSTAGAYGCLLSHLQVVREARQLGAPSVLIFEDDVAFDKDLQANFAAYISQVPADWDMLYFGALHMDDPIEISDNVKQIRRAYSTYAYALNHTIFDAFIQLNSQALTAVDINNLRLQTEHKCYCFMPHLAWVETDYSDAQEVHKNHWYLKESLVIRGRSMDRLLTQTSVIIAYRNAARNNGVTRNLLFLARFYSERLPGVSVVIVEQGAAPTINQDMLPRGCQYFLVEDDGPFNSALCFDTGMGIANPSHTFIIFSDSDIVVEEWDICASLRMCQRYDGTTGFTNIIELTTADTLKLIDDRAMLMRWFKAKKYSVSDGPGAPGNYRVFNRRSIEAVGGWKGPRAPDADPFLSLNADQRLRIFQAPNYALRLHHE